LMVFVPSFFSFFVLELVCFVCSTFCLNCVMYTSSSGYSLCLSEWFIISFALSKKKIIAIFKMQNCCFYESIFLLRLTVSLPIDIFICPQTILFFLTSKPT
jgi:hypothetical protein